ncbi:MAG: PRC-barrel domain-containing protein [Paracoccus sp. (in: a-proteobacteria)]|uniref:PRC-barrel domain-containing protein n=1 Tax=Paracoccus sp. TaxID=267 RepID=UPI002E89FACB|nr:PRC-barrel domain-containing protein [Pseudomonadota bacterium]
MKQRLTHILAASLLCSTAAPALAQEAADGMGQDTGSDYCTQLERIADEYNDRLQQEWLDQARPVIDAGDDAACEPYVVQVNAALDQGDQAEMIEGRIVVTQPDPTVTVDQPAPEVSVTQPEPNVDVTVPRPQIIVRQAQPTVTIDMPRPTVTIDQPDPEIIVRMPDPQVDVSQAEPQINVEQAEPTVNVEQGEAQVDVALQDAQDTGGADVEIEQGTPQVRLNDGGQAQVDLEQMQPEVVYESADPIIEFTQQEDPQVEFNETGEADVSVEDQAANATTDQEMPQQDMQQQDDAAMNADWRQGREAMMAPAVELEGYAAVDQNTISVEELNGAEVYGQDESNIGDVEDVRLSEDGVVEFFIVDVGGFLGIGAHTVALGLDEVTVLRSEAGDEIRVYVDASREQLEQMPAYEA